MPESLAVQDHNRRERMNQARANPTKSAPVEIPRRVGPETLSAMRDQVTKAQKAIQVEKEMAEQRITKIDPQFRPDVRAERAAVIRAEAATKAAELLGSLDGVVARAEAQREYYAPRAVMRRTPVHEDPVVDAITRSDFARRIERTPSHQLAAEARLQASEGKLALVELVLAEAGRRNDLGLEDSKAINDVASRVAVPDSAEVLGLIEDIHIAFEGARIAHRETATGREISPTERLTFYRRVEAREKQLNGESK